MTILEFARTNYELYISFLSIKIHVSVLKMLVGKPFKDIKKDLVLATVSNYN